MNFKDQNFQNGTPNVKARAMRNENKFNQFNKNLISKDSFTYFSEKLLLRKYSFLHVR